MARFLPPAPVANAADRARQLPPGHVRELVNHPALPEVIPRLSPQSLNRLYQTVGLHDAGALMAMTPPQLLARALDEAAWVEHRDGTRFDPDVFIDWLEIWLGEGEAFAAEQLLALGEDLLTVCLGAVVTVVDSSVDGFHRWNADDGDSDVSGDKVPLPPGLSISIERFLVVPQEEDEWDLLDGALQALWSEAPDTVLRLLERLTADDSRLEGEELRYKSHDDPAAARDDRRERAGYVSSVAAAAFLGQVRVLGDEGVVGMTHYDLETARHFSRLAADAEADHGVDGNASGAGASAPRAASGEARASHSAIWALLTATGVLEPAVPAGLLTGPANEPLRLERCLEELAGERPDSLEQVSRELAYLANVLLTLALPESGNRHAAARELAFATANLGLELLEARGASVALHRPPGTVRAFLLGWAMLLKLPERVARSCEAALASAEVRQRLTSRRWLDRQMQESLDDLSASVRERHFDAAREALTLLSLALNPDTCRAAVHLLGVPPQFPALLEGGTRDSARWIRSLRDLEQLAALLGSF